MNTPGRFLLFSVLTKTQDRFLEGNTAAFIQSLVLIHPLYCYSREGV